jgi:acetoin utilization deacetylase AcuC-like enzyme
MERIISAVICGQTGVLLYTKLLADGKKKYFEVDVNWSKEISITEYNQQIEKHGHIIFYIKNQVKHRALIIEGLDIPREPLFRMFLFENKVEKIFQTIINLDSRVDHYQLLDLEKSFYNDPELCVALRNKLKYWREDHTLSTEVVSNAEKICRERGYIKLLHLIENLSDKTLV